MPVFLRLFVVLAGSSTLVTSPFSVLSQNTEVSQRFTLVSPDLDENSGMIRYKNRLLFINDSKNEALVFVCDTISGAILNRCAILRADNRDWEDLAADNFFLYIGDFGNNSGMRGICTIYRVPLECVVNQKTCKAESITFECSDQNDFSKRPRQHNFDFEALAVWGDSLLLFSKNWGDLKSRLYVLPKKPGHYRVSPRLTVNVNGLITGADYLESDKILVLCGYKLPPADPENFIILWKNFSLPVSTSVTFKRLAISGITLRQTEGIVVLNPARLWVSHEGRSTKDNQVAPSVIEIRLPSP